MVYELNAICDYFFQVQRLLWYSSMFMFYGIFPTTSVPTPDNEVILPVAQLDDPGSAPWAASFGKVAFERAWGL